MCTDGTCTMLARQTHDSTLESEAWQVRWRRGCASSRWSMAWWLVPMVSFQAQSLHCCGLCAPPWQIDAGGP